MLSNANDPRKWILNYQFKKQTGSLTKTEKELEFACHQIEAHVVEVKARRRGSGKLFCLRIQQLISTNIFINLTLN